MLTYVQNLVRVPNFDFLAI